MSKRYVKKAITLAATAAMILGNLYFAPENVIVASADTTYNEVDDATLDAVLAGASGALTKNRNSVHDPSIVTATVDGVDTYYVFGSHMGVSKTTDFLNWTSVTGEREDSTLFGTVGDDGSVSPISYNQAFRNNAYTGKVTILVDGVETEVDFGTYDASAWNTALDSFIVQGNMWANGGVDIPSYDFRKMLYELNNKNEDTGILIRAMDGYSAMKLGITLKR